MLNGRLWTPKRRVAVLLHPWVRPTISTVTCTSRLTWQDAAGGSGQEAHSPGVLPKHLSGMLCLILPRALICPSPERNMGFRVTCPQIALQMMSEHSFAKKRACVSCRAALPCPVAKENSQKPAAKHPICTDVLKVKLLKLLKVMGSDKQKQFGSLNPTNHASVFLCPIPEQADNATDSNNTAATIAFQVYI